MEKKREENFERGLTLHCPPNSICVVKKHSKKKEKVSPFFSILLFSFLRKGKKKKRDGCLFDEGSLVWKKEQKKTWVNFFCLKGKKEEKKKRKKKKRWEIGCWRGVALFVCVLILFGSS